MLLILGAFFGIVSLLMAGFIFREGKVNFVGSWSVYGKPAYAIGCLIVAYVPLSGLVLYVLRATGADLVDPANKDLVPAAVLGVCLGVLLVCLIPAALIGCAFAENDAAEWWKRPKRRLKAHRRRQVRPRRGEYELLDDADDRPHPRRFRPRFDEADEDDRPRRRSRRDDY